MKSSCIFKIAILSSLSVLNAGCELAGTPIVTAMHLANVADQRATGERASKLWDEQRENVRGLQARGDPMGDYLYALGNAQGWIGDTSDPLQIRDLFEKAAKEGSSDAKIVLGIFYFTGVVPHQHSRSNSIWLPDDVIDHQRGTRLIREGMRVRCTYTEPVVDGYSNHGYMRNVSAAAEIWPKYRDGQYRRDPSGRYVTILEKDAQLEREWRSIDSQCRSSGATSE